MTEINNFIWPEYDDDKQRIKANTKKYANVSIVEAFEMEYGIKINSTENANLTPIEPKVGDIIRLNITRVSKNKVDFECMNIKSPIMSTVNLYKYERFKHPLPVGGIFQDCRVINVSKDRIDVDPISVMMDDWLNNVIKNPNIQKVMNQDCTPIKVRNLKLVSGGFLGDAVVPSISKFVGEDYTVDAFIPGSQIVLNITDDFEKFIGEEVNTFVLNCIQRPGSTGKSLICSAKEYIKFQGEKNLIKMFGDWCEENEAWNKVKNKTYKGIVTGVINSSKKCGVFVEIPSLKITGMVPTKPNELVQYKPQSPVNIQISTFDEETFYDPVFKQKRHVEPYVIKDGYLDKCNIKPVLKFA